MYIYIYIYIYIHNAIIIPFRMIHINTNSDKIVLTFIYFISLPRYLSYISARYLSYISGRHLSTGELLNDERLKAAYLIILFKMTPPSTL